VPRSWSFTLTELGVNLGGNLKISFRAYFKQEQSEENETHSLLDNRADKKNLV